MATFGRWLRQRRISLGLSQKALADKIGYSAAMIRKIEAGERRASQQIAEVLVEPLGIADSERAAFLHFARVGEPPGETASFLASRTNIGDTSALPTLLSPLTERERHILRLMALRIPDVVIAGRLSLTVGTVRWYVKQIYSKLGVHSREEAIERAAAGLPPPPPSAPPARHNLPLQLSSFIGREQELAEVRRLLASSRLVTLTGAGGTGKTRLALQVGAEVSADFADGVWFVELAPLFDPALVPRAVASALEVREVGDRPLLDLLLNYLGSRRLLLLLDNCEHLVEATAQLADTLLRRCPQLQILATSRERLNIAGELVWVVPTLSLPDRQRPVQVDGFMQYDAIRLFVERAVAAAPGLLLTAETELAGIAQLCARLDGLPLAIELAAARMRAMTIEQIAARLEPRFNLLTGGSRAASPRHQTLQATIEWSYNLLPAKERRLFQRLSVFAGGWTLEAAEVVCSGNGLDEDEVADLLTHLVHASLVVVAVPSGDGRYRMLELIRQYADEKLAKGDEAAWVRDRHLAFFGQLAETAEPRLSSGEQLVWLERLAAETDNVRAALAWSLENHSGDVEAGVRLATGLVEFWVMAVYLREGHRWLELALTKRYGVALSVQARLLLRAGWLWTEEGNSEGVVLLQESLALYRQMDDKRGMAWSLFWLGWYALHFKWDLALASTRFAESLTLAGDIDDDLLLAWLYGGLARLATLRGDYDQATELAARGLVLARQRGDLRVEARLLNFLGRSAMRQRDYARASEFYHEAWMLERQLNNIRGEVMALMGLGMVARCQRAYEQAARFYEESLALVGELNSRTDSMYLNGVGLYALGVVALGQGDRPQANLLFGESLSLAQESKWKDISLWNIWGLARVALAEGHMWRAVQLLAASRPMWESADGRLDPIDQEDYEREVTLARIELGEEAFAATWAEGQAMTLEQAIAYALEECGG